MAAEARHREAKDDRNMKGEQAPDQDSYHVIRDLIDGRGPWVLDHGANTEAHDNHSDSSRGGEKTDSYGAHWEVEVLEPVGSQDDRRTRGASVGAPAIPDVPSEDRRDCSYRDR